MPVFEIYQFILHFFFSKRSKTYYGSGILKRPQKFGFAVCQNHEVD